MGVVGVKGGAVALRDASWWEVGCELPVSWYQEAGILMVGREFSANPSLRRSSNSLLILGNRFLASWRTCEILILVGLSRSREGDRICVADRELI